MTVVQGHTVLVTGGCGFIGNVLVRRLEKFGASVVTLGVKKISTDASKKHLNIDLRDASAVKAAVAPLRPGYVFNLGGYIDHAPFRLGGRRVVDAHFTGTANLIEAIDWDGLKAFVQVGSSDEYGGAAAPQREDMREAPISPYAAAKTAATHLVQALARTENFPGVVARLFLVYGPGQDQRRFLPQLINGCLRKEEIPVSGGEQYRDFCYIDDVVDGLLSCALTPEARGQVFNIASGQGVTIRSVIEMVVDIVGAGSPIFGAHPYRPGENMALYAEVARGREALGWEATTGLREGLARTIAWYQDQFGR
jgi:nucleoside-diphosphate-sugar epimerase